MITKTTLRQIHERKNFVIQTCARAMRAKISFFDCGLLEFAYFHNELYLLPMRACSPSEGFASNTLANYPTSSRQ